MRGGRLLPPAAYVAAAAATAIVDAGCMFIMFIVGSRRGARARASEVCSPLATSK